MAIIEGLIVSGVKKMFEKVGGVEGIKQALTNGKSNQFNKQDLAKSTSAETTNTIKIIKYPHDIDTNPLKLNKSVTFYILKNVEYMKFAEKVVENSIQAVKRVGTGLKDMASNVVEGVASGEYSNTLKNIGTESIGILNTAVGDILGKNGSTGSLPENYKKEAFEAIFKLPIPNNIMDQDSHSYSDGKFENTGAPVKAVMEGYNTIKDFGDSIVQTGAYIGDRNRQAPAIPQLPVLNPYQWQKYEGSSMKTFSFVFFFVPRTKEEANEMMRIVYLLKKFSYPDTVDFKIDKNEYKNLSSAFVEPPPKVLIKFNNPKLQKLINPGICVIESVTTTFNEGQTVGLTQDGVPRFIEVNLTIKEYNQRFRSDFESS